MSHKSPVDLLDDEGSTCACEGEINGEEDFTEEQNRSSLNLPASRSDDAPDMTATLLVENEELRARVETLQREKASLQDQLSTHVFSIRRFSDKASLVTL